MIFTSSEQIFEVIQNPKNTGIIERAISIKERHELHVSGIGLEEWLQKVDGVENDAALATRRKLSNEATVAVMANSRKPKNKIFTATGSYRFYDISNEDLKHKFKTEVLQNVDVNTSISEWMRTEWCLRVDTDPMAMAFIEIKKDGNEAYITYKSPIDYYDIDFSATNKIEYVVFNPTQGKDGERFYRVVDDAYDYLVKQEGDDYSIVEDETFSHPFGIVPGVFFSSRNDKQSKSKDTWISEAMPSADDYLFDNSIYRVYKTKVGIPYVWEVERQCPTCEGVGTVGENADKCPSCNGLGYAVNRDVADKIIKAYNEDNNGVPVDTGDPAGYIQADPSSQTQMVEEQDRLSRLVYLSIWGGSPFIEKEGVKTAYEIGANKEPEIDKLKMISKNAELVESFITDMFGIFYLGESYKGNIVRYGTKYNLKTPDTQLEIYNKAKNSGASISTLNELLVQYYHTQHEDNPVLLERSLKLMLIEPYVHNTLEEMTRLAPSGLDYMIKQNFNEYINRYEEEKQKIDFATVKEVKEELKKYAEQDLNDYKPFIGFSTQKQEITN